MRSSIIVWGSVITLWVAGCASTPTAPTPDQSPEVAQVTQVAPVPQPTTPAPAPAPVVTTPTRGSVYLVVLRAGNDAPVDRAEITIDAQFVGETDSAGRFQTTVTYGQAYNVTVYQGEYVTAHLVMTFAPPVDSQYIVRLTPICPGPAC